EEDRKKLRSYVYSQTKSLKFLEKLLGRPFNSMAVPIDKPTDLVGKAAKENRIIINSDILKFTTPILSEKISLTIKKITGMNLLIVVPVNYQGKLVGALLTATKKDYFSNDQIGYLNFFANQLGLAIGNTIAHEKIVNNFKQNNSQKDLDIITETNKLFSGKLNPIEVSEAAANLFSKKMNFVGVGVFIKDSNKLRLLTYSRNKITAFIDKILPLKANQLTTPLDNPENLIGKSAKEDKLFESDTLLSIAGGIVSNDVVKLIEKGTRTKHYLAAPIVKDKESIGAIICSTRKNSFSKNEIVTVQTFADQLSVAMSNAIAHEKIINKYREKDTASKEKKVHKKNLETINHINTLIAGNLDFKEIAEKSIAKFVEDNVTILGVQISVIENNKLKALLYTKNQKNKFMESLISDKAFRKLETPLDPPQNLAGQTAVTGKISRSENLLDVCKGILPNKVINLIDNGIGAKEYLTLPIKSKGITKAVLLTGKKDEKVNSDDLEMIKIFTDQLGLAMSNALTHEKIINKYEEKLEKINTETDHEPLESYLDIISSTNNLLTGEFDFKKVAEKAVTGFIERTELMGAHIYRKEGNFLKAYLYSRNKATNFLSNIFSDKRFRNLRTPIDSPENLIGKTAKEGKIHECDNLIDLGKGVLPDKMLNIIHKGARTKKYILVPLICNNKVEAVLIVATKETQFTPDQISLIKIFAEQLGLAMGNIIAHEKIIEK
ncbi:GAF domain-containing protein, partial [Patescibacteria group bacterium]|nr:GAF domain-containing protein [Patescibacteria group bacterium]